MQGSVLLAKWFICVLNPEVSLWCALACSLFSRHSATAGRTLSDLLAGNVSSWRLKGMPTFWHSLLKTWDVLDGGARTNIVVPPNTGLKTSALLVFVRTDDDRLIKASKSWHKIGIQQASDIIEWHRPEMILRVKDTQSNIHHRLRKRLATGQIKLSPFFERLRDGAAESLEEYEALWQLASLAAKPLYEYTPKMGRAYQQQCVATATSSYSYPIMPVNVW
jgi:hypothetical protein